MRPTTANVITQQELEALAAANAAEKAESSKPADASDTGAPQCFHSFTCCVMSVRGVTLLPMVTGKFLSNFRKRWYADADGADNTVKEHSAVLYPIRMC